MERHQILMAWKAKPMGERVTALAGYALLLVVTCFIIFVSPTRGNRFFSLSTPDFGHFIRDRVDYYSAIYLSIGARLLLFFPIVYVAGSSLITWRSERRSVPVLLFITVLAAVCSMLLFRNILIALPLLVLALAALAVYPNREMWHVRRLLPFMACLLIASGTLLVTIQLVKTQLTEIAMLTIILSGWGWSVWVGDVRDALALAQNGARVRRLVMACVAVIVVLGIAGTMPRLVRQEHILRDVRDVRKNANDALAWSAQNLPPNSLFAVALYSLHGIERLDLVTSKDDETKVREQYTFDGGFVYYVFEVLGRRDIRHAYLADPELLPRVLTAMRAQPNSYLFLQSALDLQLFHGSSVRQPLIGMRDTLVARFGRGPYPCEVWMMRE